MNIPSTTAAKKRAKGFTLTEIAIVLGIIGLILGAIWVAASSVFSNQKVARASTQLLTIAQSVRTLYATSASTSEPVDTDLTSALCNAGAFPSDTVINGCTAGTLRISNPWNGNTTVASSGITTGDSGDAFVVTMTSVPTAGCIAFLTSVGGLNHESGLIYIGVADYTAGTETDFPVTVSTASGLCSATTTDKMMVAAFKLKG